MKAKAGGAVPKIASLPSNVIPIEWMRRTREPILLARLHLDERVFVHENVDGVPIGAIGVVTKIRSGGSAWILLDVQSPNEGAHPFRGMGPDDIERVVIACPQQCSEADESVRPAVPVADFGLDHWMVFAYLFECNTYGGGVIDIDRMRCDSRRHPRVEGNRCRVLRLIQGADRFPTRLRGGLLRRNHDDWDCLWDLVEAGLVVPEFMAMDPLPSSGAFTARGRAVMNALSGHLATGRTIDTFIAPARALAVTP